MIHPVNHVRRALNRVPGAFYDFPPDEVPRGSAAAVQELWSPQDESAGETDLVPDVRGVRALSPDGSGADHLEQLFEFGAEIDLPRMQGALAGSEGETIRKSIEVHGVDALGWYVPFHARGAQWGIYISISGIAYLMVKVFLPLRAEWDVLFRLAFRAIHQHEVFHFGVEYFSAQWELLHGEVCHKPAQQLLRRLYRYNPREEECANAHMVRQFRAGGPDHWLGGKTSLLRRFIKGQPPGYRDGGSVTSTSAFEAETSQLLKEYAQCAGTYVPDRHLAATLTALLPGFPAIEWRDCPVHLVHDGERFGVPEGIVRFIARIEAEIDETGPFLKQLAKLPVSVAEAWRWAKHRLRQSTIDKGLDFKPWKDGKRTLYSIRLSRQYRAHLEHERASGRWLAIAVGTHRAMGHG